jgi:DNA-binding CsgD family transcriptional regulator
MEITPDLVANEIIDNINEMVFILDPSLKISLANNYAVSSLNLNNDFEKNPLFFTDIVQLPENSVSFFETLKINNTEKMNLRITFRNENHMVYADSFIAQFNDSFNEVSGYLLLARINQCINDFIRIFKISKREMEIIELCIEGKSSRQIADLLCISERTVETHLTNIFQKTETSNRIELFALASRYGMIP